MASLRIPVGEATEINPERINVGPDGRAIPSMEPKPLGARGPQFNRTMVGSTPAPTAPAQVATTPAAAQSLRTRVATGVGRTVGSAARVALSPAALLGAAATSGYGTYHINDPEIDSSAGGTLNYIKNGEGGKLLRSLSNGALETGLDLAHGGAGMIDSIAGTHLQQSLRDRVQSDLGDQIRIGQPAAAAAVAPASPAGSANPAQENFRAAELAGASPSAPLQTQEANYQSPALRNVSTIPGTSTADTLRQIDTIRGLGGNPMDPYGSGAHGPDGSGGLASIGSGGSISSDAHAKFDQFAQRETLRGQIRDALSSRNPHDRAAAMQLAGQAEGIAGNERVAGLREAGENARASAQLGLSRYLGDRNAQLQLRGQDITREGHMINAAGQRAQLLYNINKDQRDFNLRKDEVDNAERERGQKSISDWLQSSFQTTDANGKAVPDSARIASFTQASTRMLGNVINQFKNDPDPAKRAYAEKLSKQGLQALDPEDRAAMLTLFGRMERFQQARSGIVPGTASGAVSGSLNDYEIVGHEPGLLQDRYRLRGGQSIPVNDVRYREGPANLVLPDVGKTPTTDLGPTPQERERLRQR